MKNDTNTTNADMIRNGYIPCETNPDSGNLSQLSDLFHAHAFITVGQQKGNLRHVCSFCARRHHSDQKQRHGIKWE